MGARARRVFAFGALAGAGAAVAVAAIAACDDVPVHILSAQAYSPQYACLGPTAGVDVVQGSATGDNCDPTCLTVTASSTDPTTNVTTSTTYVYITTTCPPYPSDYTQESQAQATDPSDPCTGAFAAYAAGATCPPTCTDGGGLDVCIPGDDGGGSAETGGGDDGGGETGAGDAGSEAGDDGGGADAATE
jgi:hypothetical protein